VLPPVGKAGAGGGRAQQFGTGAESNSTRLGSGLPEQKAIPSHHRRPKACLSGPGPDRARFGRPAATPAAVGRGKLRTGPHSRSGRWK
jgi:hypothetical protein